jgi:hypothetical protein
MTTKIIFIVFGIFLGAIIVITGASLIDVSTPNYQTWEVGDISNSVIAIGALFSLGFSLWQHQQLLDRDKKEALPRIRLVEAPIRKIYSFDTDLTNVEV